MKARVYAVLAVSLAGNAWSQPNTRPEVDWASIEKQLEALRTAVQSRDIKVSHDLTQRLWDLTTAEWLKQSPTPAERLAQAEARRPSGDAVSAPYLAMLAVQAGQFEKAQSYAYETLHTPSPAYDSIHSGNIVLGLVALNRDHDLALAKDYLLRAAHTKGSMLLDRWGPNLALAKALLDKGEKDVVLRYFEASKSFVTKNPKLNEWIAMLKGGGTPDLAHEFLWHQ